MFVGYSLAAYGLSQVRKCNAGLWDLVWPGRFAGCNPDTGTGVVTGGASSLGSRIYSSSPGSNPWAPF